MAASWMSSAQNGHFFIDVVSPLFLGCCGADRQRFGALVAGAAALPVPALGSGTSVARV